VIAVDTNILIHAHREDAAAHVPARDALLALAGGAESWAIPWPCVHEFLAIVTHPRVFDPPTPLDTARDTVGGWIESPQLVLLAETAGYWDQLSALLGAGRVVGPRVHDARIAALCLAHGVRELWSADRDFGRFPALRVRNPMVQ
jgi:uncharacterized protein